MPRLSEFYGIVVDRYFVDHNPPHFHAIYAEHEALIRIDDGSSIRGEPPRTAAKLVEQRRELHVAELMHNWAYANSTSRECAAPVQTRPMTTVNGSSGPVRVPA